MDFGLVTGAVTAITAAKDLGRAALAVRDFNMVADAIAKMNDQLLKAQESLFTHNSQLLELQREHFEATEELRRLKDSISKRERYSLVEIASGNFAYRSNDSASGREASDEVSAQLVHYLCQPCFDRGVTAVLGLTNSVQLGNRQVCPACRREIFVGYGKK